MSAARCDGRGRTLMDQLPEVVRVALALDELLAAIHLC